MKVAILMIIEQEENGGNAACLSGSRTPIKRYSVKKEERHKCRMRRMNWENSFYYSQFNTLIYEKFLFESVFSYVCVRSIDCL
jgi:hypothetical protein